MGVRVRATGSNARRLKRIAGEPPSCSSGAMCDDNARRGPHRGSAAARALASGAMRVTFPQAAMTTGMRERGPERNEGVGKGSA